MTRSASDAGSTDIYPGESGLARPLTDRDLDTLFRRARTYRTWLDKPVSAALIQAVYDLARMGPTSANCCPARFVFVTSKKGKDRLRPHLDSGNVDKTMAAPVTAIVAHDLEFYERMPQLNPHNPGSKSWFDTDEELAAATAFRNGSLQGAYLILAARALGLDCGPMSGFDNGGLDREFFDGTAWRSNFLVNIGYGDPESLHPRAPRLSFDEACKVV